MLLGVALVMALVIKTFFVQAFYIPSESMEPGLVTNDRILVQKPSYWFGEPDRGDVVVFEDPGGWLTGPVTGPQTWLAKGLAKIGLYPTGGHLVKRVVGVAGDTITCCDKQGRILVNGEPIDDDDFIRPQPDPPASCDGPDGLRRHLPVEGDRAGRPAVRHGRQPRRLRRLLGAAVPAEEPECDTDRAFVPVELVVGKVFALVWPLGHAEFVGTPTRSTTCRTGRFAVTASHGGSWLAPSVRSGPSHSGRADVSSPNFSAPKARGSTDQARAKRACLVGTSDERAKRARRPSRERQRAAREAVTPRRARPAAPSRSGRRW